MIKINVTNEMFEAAASAEDAAYCEDEERGDLIRAVLAIVEQELNEKRGELYAAILHKDPEAIESEIFTYEVAD